MKRLFLALIAVAFVLDQGMAAESAGNTSLDPNQPYTATMGPGVTYDASFDVVFTAPSGTKQAEVWLPVPKNDKAQQVEGYRTEPAAASDQTEPLYQNRFVHFTYDNPQGGQIIKIVKDWPESFAPYLRSEPKVVVDKRAIELARTIVGEEKNPILQTRLLMAYIMKTLNYDHTTCSLEASSVWALDKMVGHCSDYHGLATALARACNIPARVTYGINPLPKNSPTHCKAEFYFSGYGWVSFDVSETQRLTKKIEKDATLDAIAKREKIKNVRDRFEKGFRDNTWYKIADGTSYTLAPATKSETPALVRTAFIEADGKPLQDPDPGNSSLREFAWMTVANFKPNQPVEYPFK
jgi:transglutaminase-like putative cysteine protease